MYSSNNPKISQHTRTQIYQFYLQTEPIVNESPLCGAPVGIKPQAKAWPKNEIFGLRVKTRSIVRIKKVKLLDTRKFTLKLS